MLQSNDWPVPPCSPRNLAVQGDGTSGGGESVDPVGYGVGLIVIGNVEHLDHSSVLEHGAAVIQRFVAAQLGVVQASSVDGFQHLFQRLVAKEPHRFGGCPVSIAQRRR